MKLVSVNVAQPATVQIAGRPVLTSIGKAPAAGPVFVGRENLAGDRQSDLTVHGGAHQAAYAYPREHYAYWEEELGRGAFPPGQFGENLTVENLLEADVRVGDRLRVGTALLEVSMPTERCAKPGRNAGVPLLLKWIVESGRAGWYLRVLEPGTLQAGDAIDVVERGPEPWTVQRLSTALYRELDCDATVAALHALPALSPEWKERVEALRKRRRG